MDNLLNIPQYEAYKTYKNLQEGNETELSDYKFIYAHKTMGFTIYFGIIYCLSMVILAIIFTMFTHIADISTVGNIFNYSFNIGVCVITWQSLKLTKHIRTDNYIEKQTRHLILTGKFTDEKLLEEYKKVLNHHSKSDIEYFERIYYFDRELAELDVILFNLNLDIEGVNIDITNVDVKKIGQNNLFITQQESTLTNDFNYSYVKPTRHFPVSVNNEVVNAVINFDNNQKTNTLSYTLYHGNKYNPTVTLRNP